MSCSRITAIATLPMKKKNVTVMAYSTAMRLWSVVASQDQRLVVSR